MALSLKPEYLKRYKDIGLLLWKYGRSDLVKKSGIEDVFDETERPTTERSVNEGADPKAEELAKDLEQMGPIFVKLGQILSSRADFLPLPYIKALTRLQDKLEPFPFAEVERIVQEELGVRISKAFLSFDTEPIAAASLGQVHHAVLRDGREVAVKVQRPGIRHEIAQDLDALEDIAEVLDKHTELGSQYQLTSMLEEFRKNLARELDYREEARHLEMLHNNLSDFPSIVIPLPVHDYSTSVVLTMDYIQGKKVTALGPLARIELKGEELAEDLFRAYLKQVLVDGFFHADPHPGNVFVTSDQRLALIDLGLIGRVSPLLQERLLKLLLAISNGESDDAADVAMKLGEIGSSFREMEFRHKVSDLLLKEQDSTIAELQVGSLMLEFSRTCMEHDIRMPVELSLIGKMLLNLDEIGRTLDPTFNPNASIQRNAYDITRKRMMQSMKPGNLFSAAIETKEFIEALPKRVNRILDQVAKNEIKLQVDAIEEQTLIDGFQKVSNRITMGLILAALIVGAAMLMRVETTFRLFGYPGLAMICFLLAAGGGCTLLISIVVSDRAAKKAAKK